MSLTTAPLAHLAATCEHDTSRAVRVGQDAVSNAWECDDCGHLTPFTDDDYTFCNASPWAPRAPAGIERLAWLLMDREARLATLTA